MTILDQLDALLISNPTNIRYLTGFVGASQTEREAYVLVTNEKTYLFTSALYKEQAKRLPNITNVEISRQNPLSKKVLLLSSRLFFKKIGFEDTNLTVSELTKLKEVVPDVSFVATRDRVEDMRMMKRNEELDSIRAAARITDQCFKSILNRIRPGISEARLFYELEGFLRVKSGDVAFSPIVAFNQNSSMPHYHSRGNNPLRNNSLVLLDFGARVNGYCSDMTRVVFLGTPKEEWVKAYQTVLSANSKAITMLKQGERNGSTLDAAARNIVSEAGFPVYPHSLGHAVGLDIHESPRLTIQQEYILKSDMVVTVEPGIYIEGSYGIRIEDLVRLTDSGIEILSQAPKEIITL